MKLTLAFLICFCSSVWAQNPPAAPPALTASELQIQIERVKKEIAEEEKQWAEEQARENDAEKKRRERYEAFLLERQEIQRNIGTVETQLQERSDLVERLKSRTGGFDSQVAFLRRMVQEKAREFAGLLEKSFPYRLDKRKESVHLLIDDLAKERISPEEGFNRLWVLYQAEHALASDAEIYSGTVELADGSTSSVKFMRVGKQILAYINPAGDRLGVLVPTRDGSHIWKREDMLDYRTRVTIRNAIAVAEGKAVPGFVEFPLWIESFPYFSNTSDGIGGEP